MWRVIIVIADSLPSSMVYSMPLCFSYSFFHPVSLLCFLILFPVLRLPLPVATYSLLFSSALSPLLLNAPSCPLLLISLLLSLFLTLYLLLLLIPCFSLCFLTSASCLPLLLSRIVDVILKVCVCVWNRYVRCVWYPVVSCFICMCLMEGTNERSCFFLYIRSMRRKKSTLENVRIFVVVLST